MCVPQLCYLFYHFIGIVMIVNFIVALFTVGSVYSISVCCRCLPWSDDENENNFDNT